MNVSYYIFSVIKNVATSVVNPHLFRKLQLRRTIAEKVQRSVSFQSIVGTDRVGKQASSSSSATEIGRTGQGQEIKLSVALILTESIYSHAQWQNSHENPKVNFSVNCSEPSSKTIEKQDVGGEENAKNIQIRAAKWLSGRHQQKGNDTFMTPPPPPPPQIA